MNRRPPTFARGVLALALTAGLAGCGDSAGGDARGEIVDLDAVAGQFCRQACQRQADCADDTPSDEAVDACVDGCTLGVPGGSARGDGCEAAGEALLRCEAQLNCSAPQSGACSDEIRAIAAACTVVPDEPNGPGPNPDPGANVITGDVTDLTDRGQWGGIIVSGFGVNGRGDANGELLAESPELASSDAPRWYGGDDNADDSGFLRYVVVAEAGVDFYDGAGAAITLEAVGRGTTVDHVQVLGAEVDGFAWFGGAVNATHLVVNGVDDDSLDLDDGYVGQIQYALVRMGDQNGDRGIEADSRFDDVPVSTAQLANVTVLGNAGSAENSTLAALHREGFAGAVYRSVFTDDHRAGAAFENGCLDVDRRLPADFRYRDVIFDCAGGALADDDDTEDGSVATNFQTDAVNTGQVEFTEDRGLTVTPNLAVTTTAPAPSHPLPAGLEDASYHGAVDPDAAEPFWAGWTYVHEDVDGGLPGPGAHPLEAEIRAGALTPASAHACEAINPDFDNGGFVDVFGARFPVCVLDDRIEEDTRLTSDHVYVLRDFVNVGTGDAQLEGGQPSTRPTLTVEAGTQIYGAENRQSFLVITRGARIVANGTRERPIIFGAATLDR
jgi:hypothetical protein